MNRTAKVYDERLPCEIDGENYSCAKCTNPCPDERAKINIGKCYWSVHLGTCPSDCANCVFKFRTREP